MKKCNLPDIQLDKILAEPELEEKIEVLMKEKIEKEAKAQKEKADKQEGAEG